MAAELFLTVGDKSQLDKALNGPHLRGHAEPRVAFVGRSNVGKSSLINALTGSRVAFTSATPGKTRLLNFYLWKDSGKILVDLPGYGFAKASNTDQRDWAGLINAYLRADEGLVRAIVVLDARHGPTPLDEQALGFLAFENLPVDIVFSKSDQLKNQSERARRKKETSVALERLGFNPAEASWVSSRDDDGIEMFARKLAKS